MKIAFIHPSRAFLPELDAYQTFFQSRNVDVAFCAAGEEAATGADVYWYIMGFYPGVRSRGKKIIHEYSSASVAPFRKIKNLAKASLNPRPNFRLYLNEYVRQTIRHHDEVPFGYRNQGISDQFRPNPQAEKKYDFIYLGSLDPSRQIDRLLEVFRAGSLKDKTLLLLARDYERLAREFEDCKNILFRGPASRNEIPGYLSQARYGINYIPDREPFRAQASTKFLEYAAMHIPIITSNYFWIDQFQERFGGEYFLLKDDLSNLSWRRVSAFHYTFPDMKSWHWDQQILSSGVLAYLQSVFPKIDF